MGRWCREHFDAATAEQVPVPREGRPEQAPKPEPEPEKPVADPSVN
jgi:hypothetical protein